MVFSFRIFVLLNWLILYHANAAPATTNNVPPPKAGLESNSNYIFVGQNTSPILDLSIEIDVTEDLHVSSSGVSFQVNCWTPNPKAATDLGEQQFTLSFDGTDFGGSVDTLTPSNVNASTVQLQSSFHQNVTLATDPAHAGFIPSGTTFTITILNDEHGSITAASFEMSQGETGIDVGRTISITGATAPITGFTFAIVGSGNGSKGEFTGGKGTVQYSGTTAFSPVNVLPAGFIFEQTVETGNSVYGELSSTANTALTQTWSVSS